MSSYKRIGAVKVATGILKFLRDQKAPVSGQEVARAQSIPHATAMCHLITLEDENLVRRIGEHFELGGEMALYWARRKSQLESTIESAQRELNQLEV